MKSENLFATLDSLFPFWVENGSNHRLIWNINNLSIEWMVRLAINLLRLYKILCICELVDFFSNYGTSYS